ncbi:hypothetical protein [Hymenobacter siberiensis]|uniref:hypothetical protein n=1 Tax=Hymenobacter siberiensis TaxID=2848396 RepID=UPI001C1E5307|nr:hypothetical protein [Hymenobacter siberiensis]
MSEQEFKDLLTAAEKEVGSTPGAYCSRKAAIKAMQLLLVPGQAQFTEMEKKLAHDNKLLDEFSAKMRQASETIQRQAEAIKRLEAEKTQQQINERAGIKPAAPQPSRSFLQRAAETFGRPVTPGEQRLQQVQEERRLEFERQRDEDHRRRQLQMSRQSFYDPFENMGPNWKPFN